MREAVASRASMLPGLDRARVEMLSRKWVAIVGSGALCGGLYPHLAMLGVGLVFVDDDVVAPENLANQAFAARSVGEPKATVRAEQARSLNPECRAVALQARIEALGIADLAGVDLLISAVDNRSARLRLAELSTGLAVPLLDLATDGSGRWLLGSVSFYGAADDSPCYACGFDAATLARSLAEEHPESCSSWRAPVRPVTLPTLQTAAFAAVIGAIGAQWAVAGVLGESAALDGKRLFLSMRNGQPTVRSTHLAQRSSCVLGHQRFHPLVCVAAPTVAEASEHAARLLGAAVEEITFHGRSLARGLVCPACRAHTDFARLASAVTAADVRCDDCGHEENVPVCLQSAIGPNDIRALGQRTWADLGFPRNDVVSARAENGRELHLLVNGRDLLREPGVSTGARRAHEEATHG